MIFNGLYVAGFAVAATILPATGKSYGALALIGAGYALAGAAYWLGTKNNRALATAGGNLTP
jgi:LPXTG-motif cell wall-anchored protein